MDYRELTWRERGRLWLRLGIRLVLAVLVILLLALLAPPLASLFMPFLLALVLAWILNPIVRRLRDRLGISRKILSLVLLILLFAVAGGLLSALVYNIAAELISLAQNWRAIWASFQVVMEEMGAFLDGLFQHLPAQVGETANGLLARLADWLQTVVPAFLASAAAGAGSFAMSVPSFAVSSVMFIMASYFITSDYPRLRFLVTDRLSPGMSDFFGSVKRAAVAAFGGYVKAQLILSFVIFFILLIGFSIIGQPYAVLLAFLLAVLDFIPIIGSGTAMVPWAAVDLLTGNLRHAVELMVIWGIIALFRRVAEPKVVGDQTGLSPIMSLISIYVGMKLAGVMGMILGPVVCMVVINVVKLGVLDGAMDDVRLAAGDIAALLKNRPHPGD